MPPPYSNVCLRCGQNEGYVADALLGVWMTHISIRGITMRVYQMIAVCHYDTPSKIR